MLTTEFTSLWSVAQAKQVAPGVLHLAMTGQPTTIIDSTSGVQQLLNISFRVADGAIGKSLLNLRADFGGVYQTTLFLHDLVSSALLLPAPTNEFDRLNDSWFTAAFGDLNRTPSQPTKKLSRNQKDVRSPGHSIMQITTPHDATVKIKRNRTLTNLSAIDTFYGDLE